MLSYEKPQFWPNGSGPEAEALAFRNYTVAKNDPNSGVVANEIKESISTNFYLRSSAWQPVFLVNILDISGGGKHTVSQDIERRLTEKYGPQRVLSEEWVEGLPGVALKRDLRARGLLTEPINRDNICLSSLNMTSMTTKLLNPESKIDLAIFWKGPVTIFEDMLLLWGEDRLAGLANKYDLWSSLWKEEKLEEIVRRHPEALFEGWKLMTTMIEESRKTGEMPWISWPLVDEPWPFVAMLNMSVEKSWELQGHHGIRQGEKRPFGNHPFTQQQLKLMKFMMAVLLDQFSEAGSGPMYAVGGYRADFEQGGVYEIANELVTEGQWRYRHHFGVDKVGSP